MRKGLRSFNTGSTCKTSALRYELIVGDKNAGDGGLLKVFYAQVPLQFGVNQDRQRLKAAIVIH